MSRFWRTTFRLQYAILALVDPLVRAWWVRFGMGNIAELRVRRRDGAGTRSRLVGLLHAGSAEYVGHPNGHVGWTRDLAACGQATLHGPRGSGQRKVRAELLSAGPERDGAIRATGQHPFPGNLVYRLGRRHIHDVGVFFRLTTVTDEGG
ncbi:MAG: hypothetical protein M3253_00035 [Chloroflexota bacterium]|nr:hypothetical protein [Chloroflexota bacterium]